MLNEMGKDWPLDVSFASFIDIEKTETGYMPHRSLNSRSPTNNDVDDCSSSVQNNNIRVLPVVAIHVLAIIDMIKVHAFNSIVNYYSV